MNQKTIWKQNLTQKLIHCMQELEKDGYEISKTSTTLITFSYYYRNGLNPLERVHNLEHKIRSNDLPTPESVSRAIRKARELNESWQKCDKDEQIEEFAENVGYRNQPQMKELT